LIRYGGIVGIVDCRSHDKADGESSLEGMRRTIAAA